ncbi:hypothetical protein FB45DRAFT_936958 [Roridomyces roridus]|uniref:F-box domain-containing protein n=1 Tax=Roridomyces roridus TaxID=1738132 RepID=A0AAD7FBT4_9AGAR|nr:hypothetical protein FB45DRAFT_936958 [Roridomyces roridus]
MSHRALCIPEIVAMICEDGVYLEGFKLKWDTLTSLARTCKAFQDPALNVLWRSQSTVVNVLKCMPGEIWQWEDEDPGQVTVARPIIPTDWERPLFYAHRVKYFENSLDAGYGHLLYETLRMCLPDEPLFPNLQFMNWIRSDNDWAHFPSFRSFLGPRLRTLTLDVHPSTAELSLLPGVAAQSPQLEGLSIYCYADLNGRYQSLSFLVQQLNHLRHLTVPCLDGPALDHLSQQSSLQYLTLLAQLALGIPDIPSGSFLLRFRNRLLRDVTIRLPATTPARAVAQCYNTAAMVFREHPLSALSITCESSSATLDVAASPEQIALYAISVTSLSPLFAFGDLTNVCLSGPVGLDLDDGSIARLASAWPRLLCLCIESTSFKIVPPRATLSCLFSLAQFCPDLRTLQMPIDATLIPQWQDQKPERTRPHQKALTMLNLSDSPVGPPLAVAGFLSGLFPKLESVRYGRLRDPDTGALNDAWRKAVGDALPLLRDIRDEERYWTQRENDREG